MQGQAQIEAGILSDLLARAADFPLHGRDFPPRRPQLSFQLVTAFFHFLKTALGIRQLPLQIGYTPRRTAGT